MPAVSIFKMLGHPIHLSNKPQNASRALSALDKLERCRQVTSQANTHTNVRAVGVDHHAFAIYVKDGDAADEVNQVHVAGLFTRLRSAPLNLNRPVL